MRVSVDEKADCVPDVGAAPLIPTAVVVPDHEYEARYVFPMVAILVGVPGPMYVVYGAIVLPPGT